MIWTLVILVIACGGYYYGWRRALDKSEGKIANLHSLPGHYAWYTALLSAGPALALWFGWSVFGDTILKWIVLSRLPEEMATDSPAILNFFFADVKRMAAGLAPNAEATAAMEAAASLYSRLDGIGTVAFVIGALGLAVSLALVAIGRVETDFRARNKVEAWITYGLLITAAISILTTAGIVFSVLFESIRFFQKVPATDFLLGLEWSPQTAIRTDQVGSSGAFGMIPLMTGTLMVTLIAMLVAGPIGLASAIYLSQYAKPRFRAIAKPVMEILAGVPTVVYGFFAALTVAPFIRNLGESIGLSVSSESALAAGGVMGIMIIPFVSSLSDDAISAVPQSLRDASLGLGATTAETISRVIVPAALPGIIAGFLLAISRAVGETMIVVMAAGLAANLTANPLEAVTTVTVQIVTLLVGDQEFDSAKTLSAFALGLVLFVATLLLNILALHVMRTYREKYD
ncbi:MAG: phosphate ABC transporter permease subunit PstC [Rhizobiales bacterium]|nr:phosphate ABC transporter permease subunit PstC [Hyphomicrobiales bacterium]